MGALAAVELDPFADSRFDFRSGLPVVQINAFVFQAPRGPLCKGVAKQPALSICHWQVI